MRLRFYIISAMSTAFISNAVVAETSVPTVKCEVALENMLKAGDLGTSLQALKPKIEKQAYDRRELFEGYERIKAALAKMELPVPESVSAEAQRQHKKVDEARSRCGSLAQQLESLRAEENQYRKQRLTDSLATVRAKIGEADKQLTAAIRERNAAMDDLDAFIQKNALVASVKDNRWTVTSPNKSKARIEKTVDESTLVGTVGFLNRTVRKSDTGEYALYFDEVVSLVDKTPRRPYREAIAELMGNADRVSELARKQIAYENLLQSNSSSLNKGEVQKKLETTKLELSKLASKDNIKAARDYYEAMARSFKVRILKVKGETVAAFIDQDQDYWSPRTKGFACSNGVVQSVWFNDRFVSYAECGKLDPDSEAALDPIIIRRWESACPKLRDLTRFGISEPPSVNLAPAGAIQPTVR